MAEAVMPAMITQDSPFYREPLPIGGDRICDCDKNHINCLTAKEWLKCQLGVWQFTYEGRDVRDKETARG